MLDRQQREFRVDHELIAAGHPRLSFEFAAYLANMPAHWNPANDRLGGSGQSIQFDSWRFGQFHRVRQLALDLVLLRSRDPEAIELAHLDCFRCHHALRPTVDHSPTFSSGVAAKAGWPPAEDGSLVRLRAIVERNATPGLVQLPASIDDVRMLMADFGRISPVRSSSPNESPRVLLQALAESTSDYRSQTWTMRSQAELLRALTQGLVASPPARWEPTLQLQLAIAAFVADRQSDSPAASVAGLAAANDRFGKYLHALSSETGPPSLYRSPSGLAGRDDEWLRQLRQIDAALEQFLTHLPTAAKSP